LQIQKTKQGYKTVEDFFHRKFTIPQNWNYPKFSAVVKVNPITKIVSKVASYVPMDAVDTDKPHVNYLEKRNVDKNSSLRKFQTNDVLFARITPSTENGKTALMENFSGKGIASSELTVLRPTENVEPRYLYYYVKSYRIRQFAISQMMGTTHRQRVPDYVFKKDLNFELPSIKKQQKISSILSNVDVLISSYDDMIQRTKVLKTGLMQQLLTKGIGHKKFKKVKDRFRNEFEIPDNWKYVKIGDLLKDKIIIEIQDGNHGELHPKTSDFVKDGIPFITADCLISNNIDYKKCNFLPSKFLNFLRIGFAKKDDVILSHKGSIGNTAIVDNAFETIILTPQTTYYRLSDKLIPKFLFYIFQSINFQKQMKSFAKQSTRDFVGITNQRQLFIPYVSSMVEQEKIASILSGTDTKIINSESKKSQIQILKQGLMQKLLTGQIRVRI